MFFINFRERSEIDFYRVIIGTIKTDIIFIIFEIGEDSTDKIMKKIIITEKYF